MSGDKRNTGLIGKYRVERLDGKPVDWAFVLQAHETRSSRDLSYQPWPCATARLVYSEEELT